MSQGFFSFWARALAQPALFLTAALLFAVILVNGWTDAPNAIATVVATGVLPFPRAAALAAVCNLLGVVCITAADASVARTLYGIADFGGDPGRALTALCAGMTAVVVWAVLAFRFGIPTSESHALVAGVTGAAVALQGGLAGISARAWGQVLLGLVLSLALGYFFGRLWSRLLPQQGLYRAGQVLGAGATALLHGAQDGQKFMGIFLLALALAQGRYHTAAFSVPGWLMAGCASVMALGTALGGRRIIDKIGREMVPLTPRLGFAADLASAASLTLCTLLGLPVSTTHVKTAAILGAGGPRRADRAVVSSIGLAWVFTFPGCGAVGFLTARVFLRLFS